MNALSRLIIDFMGDLDPDPVFYSNADPDPASKNDGGSMRIRIRNPGSRSYGVSLLVSDDNILLGQGKVM
jgi:hypothetical protein